MPNEREERREKEKESNRNSKLKRQRIINERKERKSMKRT
jgi:hypothetical protein